MQAFTSLSLFISLALASVAVSASPIQERDGTILCAAQPDYTRPLSLNVKFPVGNGFYEFVDKYFGLEDGSNVLVSNAADGTNFTQDSVTKFDFYECKSKFLGTSNDGNFGVLKPQGDSQNCIQTQTGSVTTDDQVMVVGPCSTDENESQENQTFQYDGNYVNFTSTALTVGAEDHPTFFRLGENDQGALHLIAGHPRPPPFVPVDTGDYQILHYAE